jgi:hypothetical protein
VKGSGFCARPWDGGQVSVDAMLRRSNRPSGSVHLRLAFECKPEVQV